MYRPNPGKNSGPNTVWAQQHTKIQEASLEEEQHIDVNPRGKCICDLKEFINQQNRSGEQLIVLTDVNQLLEYNKQTYGIRNLASNCELVDIMGFDTLTAVYIPTTGVQKPLTTF